MLTTYPWAGIYQKGQSLAPCAVGMSLAYPTLMPQPAQAKALPWQLAHGMYAAIALAAGRNLFAGMLDV
jgi:hypothetical protein